MKQQMRRGDPQRQRYWEEVVRRWRESGQSVRDFCGAEGLRESAFHYWRTRLGQQKPSTSTIGGRPLRPSKQQSAAGHNRPSFLPVRVLESTAVGPVAAEADRAVEIILERGCKVRVSAGFDRQVLAEVLAVLEARPC
jgi:hypothetical protein